MSQGSNRRRRLDAPSGTREIIDWADLRFAGEVVIVTGASSGLGAQFARALSAAGARVVLAARRSDRLHELRASLGESSVVQCDVSVDADRRRLLDRTLSAYGRVDGLVNNAGTFGHRTALHEEIEDFRRVLDVNLVAPFALACGVARVMRRAGGGAIVNVTSTVAMKSLAWAPLASYVASKAGLAGLTRELATQWGRYGITVNAIAPGPFVSEMSGNNYVAGPVAERVQSDVPLRRAGLAGELNTPLLLLLHPVGRYITGQTFAVDGGLSIAG